MESTPSNISSNELKPREEIYTDNTVQKLSKGLLEFYQPDLVKVNDQFKELTDKQNLLVEQLTHENNRLILSQNNSEFKDMFSIVKIYREKLVNIKKEMLALHERALKLKKRAIKLQQLKEMELQKRQLQLKKEQELIGNSSSQPSS